jgi:hypothetical protein
MNNLLAFLLAITVVGVFGDVCPNVDTDVIANASRFIAIVDDSQVLPEPPKGVMGTQEAALPWAPAIPFVGIEVAVQLLGEVGCPTGCAGPAGSTDRQWHQPLRRIRDPPA